MTTHKRTRKKAATQPASGVTVHAQGTAIGVTKRQDISRQIPHTDDVWVVAPETVICHSNFIGCAPCIGFQIQDCRCQYKQFYMVRYTFQDHDSQMYKF